MYKHGQSPSPRGFIWFLDEHKGVPDRLWGYVIAALKDCGRFQYLIHHVCHVSVMGKFIIFSSVNKHCKACLWGSELGMDSFSMRAKAIAIYHYARKLNKKKKWLLNIQIKLVNGSYSIKRASRFMFTLQINACTFSPLTLLPPRGPTDLLAPNHISFFQIICHRKPYQEQTTRTFILTLQSFQKKCFLYGLS